MPREQPEERDMVRRHQAGGHKAMEWLVSLLYCTSDPEKQPVLPSEGEEPSADHLEDGLTEGALERRDPQLDRVTHLRCLVHERIKEARR